MGIERWAQAEDGALVRLSIDPVGDGEPAALEFEHWWQGRSPAPEWWPPMGLVPIDAPAARRDAVAEVRVDPHGSAWSDRLESDLGLFAAEHLVDLVAVHAAVIALGDRLVVLPGPSFTGKSTLCAAAVDGGHVVWSDEYALIDPATGEVTGWPRRIKVRDSDGGTRRVSIGSMSPRPAQRAGLLAFVAYEASGEVALDVQPITAGDAAMRLLGNTVCAQLRPSDSLAAATALARSCEAVAGVRSSAAEMLSALLD